MLKTYGVVGMFSAVLMAQSASEVFGQEYPHRPIRVLTSAIGGASDIVTRFIANGMSGSLNQPVIVENRHGSLGIETVAHATPDGYTLLLYGSTAWLLPLMSKVDWDPVRNFSPITLAVSSPNILVVNPSSPVKSVKELIDWARVKPGGLDYGSGSTGSPSHLAAELFKSMARVNLVRIPYKGAVPTFNGLLGGEIQIFFATASSVTPYVTSGKLRALAVTSAEPSTLVPGLPTIAASGLPGYELVSVWGMLVPAKTPETVIRPLHRVVVSVLKDADLKEKFSRVGLEVIGGSPKEFATYIKAEMDRMGKVIKETGMRAD